MIKLNPLQNHDIKKIHEWPTYPDEFSELDYAIRKGGWIDHYLKEPSADLFAIKMDGRTIGFTFISKIDSNTCYYGIALHAHSIGQGIGQIATKLTLKYAFETKKYSKATLDVRKSNPKAKRCYLNVGFDIDGEKYINIKGEDVLFDTMSIQKESIVNNL